MNTIQLLVFALPALFVGRWFLRSSRFLVIKYLAYALLGVGQVFLFLSVITFIGLFIIPFDINILAFLLFVGVLAGFVVGYTSPSLFQSMDSKRAGTYTSYVLIGAIIGSTVATLSLGFTSFGVGIIQNLLILSSILGASIGFLLALRFH